jgi:hypothetical protein
MPKWRFSDGAKLFNCASLQNGTFGKLLLPGPPARNLTENPTLQAVCRLTHGLPVITPGHVLKTFRPTFVKIPTKPSS